MMQISTKNENVINEDKRESSTDRKKRFFMYHQNILLGRPPQGERSKIEIFERINFEL